jgi:cleavage and polyadenylation specificity factor subunit 1
MPYRYVVTFIDRFTRWVEAVPVCGITAEEIANAFVSTWVSRFGVPLEVITDRGRQFESELFKQLSKLLGFAKIRTTSFNPRSNDLIERQHRTLKTILRAHKGDWYQVLPIALFSMRVTPSSSTDIAPFTMVTGTTVHVPNMQMPKGDKEACSYIKDLATHMETLQFSTTTYHRQNTEYVPPELMKCKRVWVRIDRVKRPLESPYSGPFEVVERHRGYFTIKHPSSKMDTVAISRLKPVHENMIESENGASLEGRRRKLRIVRLPKDEDEIEDIVPHPDQQIDDDVSSMLDQEADECAQISNVDKFKNKVPYESRYGRRVKFSNINMVRVY